MLNDHCLRIQLPGACYRLVRSRPVEQNDKKVATSKYAQAEQAQLAWSLMRARLEHCYREELAVFIYLLSEYTAELRSTKGRHEHKVARVIYEIERRLSTGQLGFRKLEKPRVPAAEHGPSVVDEALSAVSQFSAAAISKLSANGELKEGLSDAAMNLTKSAAGRVSEKVLSAQQQKIFDGAASQFSSAAVSKLSAGEAQKEMRDATVSIGQSFAQKSIKKPKNPGF